MRRCLAFCSAVIIVALSLNSSLTAQPFFRGVNCGSQLPFTTLQGNVYAADRQYSPSVGYGFSGDPDSMSTPTANRYNGGVEDVDSLYYTRREGIFSYLFDVPADTYAVTLYFSEKTYQWYGFRQFSVLIEGNTFISDLDIFEHTGPSYGWPIRLMVVCTDGQINIDFIPSLAEATVNAISVLSISEDEISPPQIQNLEVIGGYEMNTLYWDFVSAGDLAGYLVYRKQSGGSWESITPDVDLQYRYFDRDVVVGTTYEYKVTAIDHWGNESMPSDSLTATPVANASTQLPTYNMDITEENLYLLNQNIYSNEYVDANLTLQGEYFPNSGVHYRGSDEKRGQEKKNYKLKLPDGDLHNGRQVFNVNANFREKSLMAERIGYQTQDLLNVLNSFTQSIHLELNNDFIGVFLDVEQVDNYFLEANGLSPGGNLYKCQGTLSMLGSLEAYQATYEKENNTGSDWSDIIDFIEWINGSSLAQFAAEADSRFAVDDFIDTYTGLVTTANSDLVNDFYLYFSPADGRWQFVSRDMNEVYDMTFWDAPINWGTQQEPIYIPDNWLRLLDKTMQVPLFRYAYCKKLERFLTGDYAVPSVQAWIDSIYAEISFDALRDIYKAGWERPDSFYVGVDMIKQFVELRVPFLLNQIPSYIPTDLDLAPYFRLNEIQSNNATTIADESGDHDPWIEIVNTSPVELDLEDFTLYYGTASWPLPAEAVVDAHGFLMIWVDGEPSEGPLHTSFVMTPGSGELRLVSGQGTQADSVAFPALQIDMVWARVEDGVGDWTSTLSPTPASTNTPWPDPSPLVINEFLTINTIILPDSAGDYDDWMEIYNPASEAIPLTGLYLTDDFTRPTRWAFPDTTIVPGGFVIVWCDNEPIEGWMHSTFKLSGDGEQIGLYDRDGTTIIDAITYGAQQADISYGRWPDGSSNWFFCTPSPGDANVGVPENQGVASLPQQFSLEPNFPNPFNSTTVIRLAVPISSYVVVRVFDIMGREVAKVQNGMMKPGYHQLSFDASNLASGIYLIRLEAESFNQARKMVLLK